MLALVSLKEVVFETALTYFVSAARYVSDIQCLGFFPLAHHLEFEGEIAGFTS